MKLRIRKVLPVRTRNFVRSVWLIPIGSIVLISCRPNPLDPADSRQGLFGFGRLCCSPRGHTAHRCAATLAYVRAPTAT